MWHLHSVMFFAAAIVLSGCRFGETSDPREDDEDVEDDFDAGEPVQSAKEYCASLAAEGCPRLVPESCPTCFCFPLEVKVLPDDLTCDSTTIETVCLPSTGYGTGSGICGGCAGEAGPGFVSYRVRDSGEVEIYEVPTGPCNGNDPVFGFTECGLKSAEPEACKCRCG